MSVATQEGATEGGGALATDGKQPGEPEGMATEAHWYALYTRSHCEQLVHDQLAAKGFRLFLPKIEVWSRRGGKRHRIWVPMLPGYLFLHHAMDKLSYIEVVKARGLVRVLGERWDRLAVVSEEEIDTLRRVMHAHLPARHFPYLRAGQRVRITGGPLAEVEGIFVQDKPDKGLVVISVDLLQRSVAVEVDCTLVVAA
ncbi:MAG: transcription termination factor NusG domain protein [Candidatus Tectimicrobiota bacterium]|nr:MAG: transcription termination factor NusG domain protein [Candidatus Tectomicrobia bacterium]